MMTNRKKILVAAVAIVGVGASVFALSRLPSANAEEAISEKAGSVASEAGNKTKKAARKAKRKAQKATNDESLAESAAKDTEAAAKNTGDSISKGAEDVKNKVD